MQRVLVLRFSAMGDVAMVASVLTELQQAYPKLELVIVSRSTFKAFFHEIPNLKYHSIFPKDKHKGLIGLYKLYKELKVYNISAVADLHDNLRSRIISFLFRLSGIKIVRIDKGRFEKKALTRDKNKILKPLKLTVERYADVFRKLGLTIKLSHQLLRKKKELSQSLRNTLESCSGYKIGISPFAQHNSKVYDLNLMEQVISQLSSLGYNIFIFGGGDIEKSYAQQMESKYKYVHNLIGQVDLADELKFISNLDLMLSMDSSGMHMASLMGVPTISIWGPTHPYAGFIGYGQKLEDCLQYDHPIRPNSVYGNKPCIVNGISVINYVTPLEVVDAIQKRLRNLSI